MSLPQPPIWPSAKSLYLTLTTHHIPGPRSISYITPFFLLPLALMIPPETLSHRALASLFVPVIAACTVHAWICMGGVDVISTDMLLWCLELIWFRDVRGLFRGVVMGGIGREGSARGGGGRGNCGNPSRGFKGQNAESRKAGEETRAEPEGEIVVNGHAKDSTSGASATNARPLREEPYPRKLLPRLHWVATLMASLRLNDWKIGSRRHDALQDQPRDTPTRIRFCLDQLPTLAAGIFLLSLTTTLAKHDPFYTNATTIPMTAPYPTTSTPAPTLITTLQTLPPPILRSLALALYAFSLISLQGTLLIPLAVTSNYLFNFPTDTWSPHTLEPYLGSISTVLDGGIRGFWGKWWHQFRRVVSSGPGVALGKWLGWRDEEAVSGKAFALQVFSAFALSGVTHMGLVPPEPVGAGGWSAWELRVRVGWFFWLQPVGIADEMALGRLFGMVGFEQRGVGRVIVRVLRFLWVVSWMCFCMPLLAPLFSELGYWKLVPPGFPFHRFIDIS